MYVEIGNLLLKTSESKKKSKEKAKIFLRKVKIKIQYIKTYEIEKRGL